MTVSKNKGDRSDLYLVDLDEPVEVESNWLTSEVSESKSCARYGLKFWKIQLNESRKHLERAKHPHPVARKTNYFILFSHLELFRKNDGKNDYLENNQWKKLRRR